MQAKSILRIFILSLISLSFLYPQEYCPYPKGFVIEDGNCLYLKIPKDNYNIFQQFCSVAIPQLGQFKRSFKECSYDSCELNDYDPSAVYTNDGFSTNVFKLVKDYEPFTKGDDKKHPGFNPLYQRVIGTSSVQCHKGLRFDPISKECRLCPDGKFYDEEINECVNDCEALSDQQMRLNCYCQTNNKGIFKSIDEIFNTYNQDITAIVNTPDGVEPKDCRVNCANGFLDFGDGSGKSDICYKKPKKYDMRYNLYGCNASNKEPDGNHGNGNGTGGNGTGGNGTGSNTGNGTGSNPGNGTGSNPGNGTGSGDNNNHNPNNGNNGSGSNPNNGGGSGNVNNSGDLDLIVKSIDGIGSDFRRGMGDLEDIFKKGFQDLGNNNKYSDGAEEFRKNNDKNSKNDEISEKFSGDFLGGIKKYIDEYKNAIDNLINTVKQPFAGIKKGSVNSCVIKKTISLYKGYVANIEFDPCDFLSKINSVTYLIIYISLFCSFLYISFWFLMGLINA